MTDYRALAEAQEFGHEFKPTDEMEAHWDCIHCGVSDYSPKMLNWCPVRIARFVLSQVIEEIERLAKERCQWCRETAPTQSSVSDQLVHPDTSVGLRKICLAQLEQRRLAELHGQRNRLGVK